MSQTWRVVAEVESPEEAGLALRDELEARGFPVVLAGGGVCVGATDEHQAAEIANLIRLTLGAAIIESSPFTRLSRWNFHHRVVGGYESST